jgi:uncharacterized damage-inducible protein DinB
MTTLTQPTSTYTPTTTKQQFLDAFEAEHARTMRVLNAFPPDQTEIRPHPKLKTARELAFIFAVECGLGTHVLNNVFASNSPPSPMPPAPSSWTDVLGAIEQTHQEFAKFIREMPDEKLGETVKFFTGPKQLGDFRRMEVLWFLLHDQIHHRGQLSVYLRMADGKVPSIYGPSGDEPWM